MFFTQEQLEQFLESPFSKIYSHASLAKDPLYDSTEIMLTPMECHKIRLGIDTLVNKIIELNDRND